MTAVGAGISTGSCATTDLRAISAIPPRLNCRTGRCTRSIISSPPPGRSVRCSPHAGECLRHKRRSAHRHRPGRRPIQVLRIGTEEFLRSGFPGGVRGRSSLCDPEAAFFRQSSHQEKQQNPVFPHMQPFLKIRCGRGGRTCLCPLLFRPQSFPLPLSKVNRMIHYSIILWTKIVKKSRANRY